VKRFCVLMLLTLQFACSSLTDQGDELFEKGLYLEAEKTYSDALQKDATDTKAMTGLQKARVKILDVGLIEVRMLRLAKNYLAAADKLEGLMQKQAVWRVQFTSGIAETQEYETRKAKEFLVAEMNREVDTGYPERAHWLGQTYRTVLESNGISPDLEAVRNKNTVAGKKRCAGFQSLPSTKDVFLRSFVSRYCSIWGTSWSSKNKIDDEWLFSDIRFENQYRVENLNYSGNLDSKGLEDSFEKVFKITPYYHPAASRVLSLRMSGTLSYKDRMKTDRRRKSYEDEEIWEEKVVTTDDKGVKHENKVKKKRKISKQFEYLVTVHDESATYASTVMGSIARQGYKSSHQDSIQRSSESHNESHFKAGIHPEKPKLLDVKAWFAQQDKAAAAAFETDLNRTWGQHFCPMISEVGQAKDEKSGQWELIERCGRVENHNQIVDTFYRSRFHLSYSEFWSLLKDEKNTFHSVMN